MKQNDEKICGEIDKKHVEYGTYLEKRRYIAVEHGSLQGHT